MFYLCASNLPHSMWRQQRGLWAGVGVCRSAPWRGTRGSAPCWPKLGGGWEGGWLSSPLCTIWPMGIKGLFINHKDYVGLKATSLPDLCMAESHCVPRGQWRDLWSRRSTVVLLNAYLLSLTHAGFASMVIPGYVVNAAQAKWCGFCSLWILSCLRS